MTIRFAAAWGGTTPAIVRALCPSAPLSAANDNRGAGRRALFAFAPTPPAADAVTEGQLLADTLRHFARHGLAAATQARAQAEVADAAGDSTGRDHWIAICRQLDRRMGDACARSFSVPSPGR